jgi:hypothetical protein
MCSDNSESAMGARTDKGGLLQQDISKSGENYGLEVVDQGQDCLPLCLAESGTGLKAMFNQLHRETKKKSRLTVTSVVAAFTLSTISVAAVWIACVGRVNGALSSVR